MHLQRNIQILSSQKGLYNKAQEKDVMTSKASTTQPSHFTRLGIVLGLRGLIKPDNLTPPR